MGGITPGGSLGMADGALGIFTGQILVHIAPQSDVDQLAAPADAENGFAGLVEGLEQFQLEQVPLVVGPADLPFGFFPEQGGIHIRSAGNDQSVKQIHIIFSPYPGHIGQHHRNGSQPGNHFHQSPGGKRRIHQIGHIGCKGIGVRGNGNTAFGHRNSSFCRISCPPGTFRRSSDLIIGNSPPRCKEGFPQNGRSKKPRPACISGLVPKVIHICG